MMEKIFISFVVDTPNHYYQAELLLFSLQQFALHPKQNIIVQCTTNVDQKFIAFLDSNGYKHHIIDKYLDGTYCNKIQQLNYFEKTGKNDIDVILLDTDTFFLDQIKIPDTSRFAAKIIDAPNPALKSIENIFAAAKITLPDIIKTDLKIRDQTSIATNFNGGFYFIPSNYINKINAYWKKWAEWLFAKKEEFNDPKVIIHLDQLSMSLAINDAGLEYRNLDTNFNCPIHKKSPQKYFQKKQPIVMLHYHNEINNFGILNYDKATNTIIKNAIIKANNVLIKSCPFIFLESFKRNLVVPKNTLGDLTEIEKEISKVLKGKKKLKLIIHGGTPKTGTKSLQFFLHNNREKLKKNGILYPLPGALSDAPKHQWLVTCLMENNIELLFKNLDGIFNQVDNKTHTIILSTEGIYNHWFDYSPDAKVFFLILQKLFDLEIAVWFRKHTDFAFSFYGQNIKNPHNELITCAGKDLSLIQMLNDKWFLKRLDYLLFIYEVEALLGKQSLKVFKYSNSSSIKDFCRYINVNLDFAEEHDRNIKLNNLSIEIVRIINRCKLPPADKDECLKYVNNLDSIISKYQLGKQMGKKEEKIINDLYSIDKHILENVYGIGFND